MDRLQTSTISESTDVDVGDAFGDRYSFQAFGHIGFVCLISTCAEDIAEPRNFFILVAGANKGQRNLFQFVTILKGTDTNDQDFLICIRDGHLCEVTAKERIITDVP